MIEMLPYILRAMFGTKTFQPTKTETFTTYSTTVKEFVDWKNQRGQTMIDNAYKVQREVRKTPISKDITGGRYRTPGTPIGITGGPPMTTTKTTVTYATGKPRTVMVLK